MFLIPLPPLSAAALWRGAPGLGEAERLQQAGATLCTECSDKSETIKVLAEFIVQRQKDAYMLRALLWEDTSS